jgi:hypothetical protein
MIRFLPRRFVIFQEAQQLAPAYFLARRLQKKSAPASRSYNRVNLAQ